jgi:hypothetical protein
MSSGQAIAPTISTSREIIRFVEILKAAMAAPGAAAEEKM